MTYACEEYRKTVGRSPRDRRIAPLPTFRLLLMSVSAIIRLVFRKDDL